MRILAIDYGAVRTGLAVTDPLQIIPGALDTVETKHLDEYLANYIAREPVDRVLIGRPTPTNGQPSENLHRAQLFAEKFKNAHPTIPIEWVDERFTSVMAHRTMMEAGLHKMARRNKPLVDRISATIILQTWMDSAHRA